MKPVLLQFPSVALLVDFINIVELSEPEVNRTSATLRGQFTNAELELALNGFGARII